MVHYLANVARKTAVALSDKRENADRHIEFYKYYGALPFIHNGRKDQRQKASQGLFSVA